MALSYLRHPVHYTITNVDLRATFLEFISLFEICDLQSSQI